jgi:hypothetical protein
VNMEITRENLDQWCKCENRGTCMGCMIQKLVRDHLGIDGERYLSLFVPAIQIQEKALELKSPFALSAKASPALVISHMSMGMGVGTVNR